MTHRKDLRITVVITLLNLMMKCVGMIHLSGLGLVWSRQPAERNKRLRKVDRCRPTTNSYEVIQRQIVDRGISEKIRDRGRFWR